MNPGTPARSRVSIVVLSLLSMLAPSARAAAGELTFEQRVAAQRAIERVHFAHQVGETRTFEQAVPRTILEASVHRYLRQSAALDVLWKTPVTAGMLDREMTRMAAGSRLPERLLELYAALGDDPLLVRECLVRPALVDRLSRSFFAHDERIHGEARERAERARAQLAAAPSAAGGVVPTPRIVQVSARASSEPVPVAGPRAHALSPEAYRAERRRWPARAGDITPVTDESDAFVVRVLLEEMPDGLRGAVYRFAKTTWDAWWQSAERGLDEARARTVATEAGTLALPRPAGSAATGIAWDNGSLDAPPDPRVLHTAVWTGSVVVVWGGDYGGAFDTGGRYDPATDTWSPTSTIGAPSPRSRHTAVWTGSRMIVWGGSGFMPVPSGGTKYEFLDTGGLYDPVTDTWTPTSTVGAAPGREGHTAVWTGSRMVVWGGYRWSGQTDGLLQSGGQYDPQTDTWTPVSGAGAPSPRAYTYTAVWADAAMLVWGGSDPSTAIDTGGRYDPVHDTWTPITTVGAPCARGYHSAVWGGSRMLVWGGYGEPCGGMARTGGRYDPVTDTWAAMSTVGAPEPRFEHTAVWTGAQMLVWGGAATVSGDHIRSGGGYDPSTDTWQPMTTTNAPDGRREHTATWTGSRMVVWGGETSDAFTDTGGRYDPVTDTWTATWNSGAPTVRGRHTAVWTGNVMIVWGGQDFTHEAFLDSGGRYDPATDSWTPTSLAGAPSGRSDHTAVWTGSRMVIWGGTASVNGPSWLDTGARYDPLTDTWMPTTMVDAPKARFAHTAVWTGTRMVVWGGADEVAPGLDTGGRYDPVADQWAPTSTTGPPEARAWHTAVWTGDRMVVWGGYSPGSDSVIATGSQYDPVADTWAPTTTLTAPSARSHHMAVWTGTRMVVWGGLGHGDSYGVNTGAIYDPAADAWTPMSTTDAPAPRFDSAAIWTGRQMVVWSGPTSAGDRSGALYDPATDTWTATPLAGAPAPRREHSVICTGTHAIVWGGTGALPLRSGGRLRIVEAAPNRSPVANAGPEQVLECTGNLQALARLDGSASSDPDSTPGTNDDIARFEWFENATTLGSGEVIEHAFALGAHPVTLEVRDRAGATDRAGTRVTVRDTRAPSGRVTFPARGACFGPAFTPVTVRDDIADVCDPNLVRQYNRAGGPDYSAHGDYRVTVTARDASGHATEASTFFTIDRVPPRVTIFAHARAWLAGPPVPFAWLFRASDVDGATGGVTRERVMLDGCVIYDGLTYGDRDGLLRDETLPRTRPELCRIARVCGRRQWLNAVVRVIATDCGGNEGWASRTIPGWIKLGATECR